MPRGEGVVEVEYLAETTSLLLARILLFRQGRKAPLRDQIRGEAAQPVATLVVLPGD